MISLALVALAAAAVTARADQVPLAPAAHTEHAPHGTPAGTDYAQLFGTESQLTYGPSPWTRGAWNGLVTFGHARPVRCWGADEDVEYDVAVIGAPFDTATSFRPGTRFGPNGIRQGSRRIGLDRINVPWKTRVSDMISVVDCGDVPMVPIDNKVALRQLELANKDLLKRNASTAFEGTSIAKDGAFHPRVLTLGGDHTITLPLLRGIAEVYGPVSVIHFDSHLDTWGPMNTTGGPWLPDEEVPVTHGSYFWYAAKEGLLAPNQSNIHVGIRNAIGSWDDYKNDAKVGFVISHAEDIEEIGWRGIVKKIREVVGDNPVYLSLDIDVLDPGVAPATGTPEIGGFSTREIKQIIKGLDGLKIVGADIVEVAPAYDTQDEITSIAAANIGWDLIALMAKNPLVA